MKTFKTKGLLASLLLVSMIATGCGKNNTSGGRSSSNFGINAYGVPGNVIQVIRQENPCQTSGTSGQQRYVRTMQLPNTSSIAGGYYVGVTSMGDIAIVVRNANGTHTMNVEVCQRGPQQVQPQLTSQITLRQSPYAGCSVGEVYGDMVLYDTYYRYDLQFRPIFIPGYVNSSACSSYSQYQ